MSQDDVIFETKGPLAAVYFNRPDRHNAMTVAMYSRLEEICETIDSDKDIRVMILRGMGGKAFIAGTDINHFRSFESEQDAIDYERGIDRVVGRLERLRCTTIAVLDGVCAGGGVPLALACDFRYADSALRFGIPVAKTLGNCLSMANIARLVDCIGVGRTKEMLMLGRLFDAEAAAAAGAIHAVYPAQELDAAVDALVQQVLRLAPLTLQAVKTGIRRAQDARRAAPDAGDDFIRRCYTSEDFHGAVEAFLAGRRYEWQGR